MEVLDVVLVHQLTLLLLKHLMMNLVLQERNAKFVTAVLVVWERLVEELRVVVVGVEEAVVKVVIVVVVIVVAVVAVDKMVEGATVVSVVVAAVAGVGVGVVVAVAVAMTATLRVILLVLVSVIIP